MKKGQILYYYDALCGWCYGFSKVISRTYAEFKEEFDFEVISGGMVLGERAGPIGKVAPYIKQAYRQVEDHTGIEFGRKFLDNLEEGSMSFSSIPPAIAMSIVKKEAPAYAIPFASDIQKMIYYEGKAPDDMIALQNILTEAGIDHLQEKMGQQHYKELALHDFQKTVDAGVGGFPTLILQRENESIPLFQGYRGYSYLKEMLNQY